MIRIPLTLAATDSQTTSVPFQNLTFISGKPQDKSEKQPCAPPPMVGSSPVALRALLLPSLGPLQHLPQQSWLRPRGTQHSFMLNYRNVYGKHGCCGISAAAAGG